MLDKKKLHFIQLTSIFTAIVIIALLYNWGFKNSTETSMNMMGQSMGSMMSSMNLKNINLNDLFKQEEQVETMSGMSTHHNTQMDSIKITHYITTCTIIVLLPFIIAGAAFLAILWLK